ncbi:translation initiation factor IF-3 [Pendulispora albinea]
MGMVSANCLCQGGYGQPMPMGRPRFDPRQQQRGFQIRVNHRIRVPEVRVIGADGSMLGVLQTHEAMRLAQEQGLDLVEVNPKAEPPVCKILDFGKYKYEEKKKTAEAKRKQTVVEIKEIKLRPKTDDHDIAFKVKAARRFIEAGHKVKVTVRFRGREITHPEKAQEQLTIVIQATDDVANVETRAMMEARTMTVLLAPKPAIMQKVAQAKIQAEKARQQAEKEGRAVPSEPSLLNVSDIEDDDDDDDDDDDTDDATAN